MNALTDLTAALDALGIPWTNGGTREKGGSTPPYIDIEPGYGEAAFADCSTWAQWMPYDVALYVRERDYALERKVEAALDTAGFGFTKTLTPIDGEDVIETAYEVNVFEY